MSASKNRKFADILRECALALATGCILAFFLQWLFGEEFSTREQARVYAPIAGFDYRDGKRDDISVLLIDEAALAAAGQVWPARYSYSARLLSAIAQYKPKAVFIDIYFGAQRDDPSLPALLRAICAMRQQGIPLFMATARNGAGQYALRPELDALAGKCFDQVAIQFTPDDIDNIAWDYPLAVTSTGGEKTVLTSAALAMYQASGKPPLKVEQHPLALTWGSRPARHGVGWLEHAGADAGAYCRPSHGLAELLPPGVRNGLYGSADKPLCVFHETIFAGDFASTTAAGSARLQDAIGGKFLLVGLGTTDSGDFVRSPLHGRIPGVYLHAMALDNLLVHGPDYPRHMNLELSTEHLPLLLFLVLSMSLVILLPKLIRLGPAGNLAAQALGDPFGFVMGHRRLRRRKGWRWGRLGVFLLLWIARLCGVLAVGYTMVWIGQRWFGLGVLSVVGAIFLTLFAEWFDLNDKIRRCLLPAAPTRPLPLQNAKEPADDLPTTVP